MAHYEGRAVRIAVAMLPTVARVLRISIEELIGTPVEAVHHRQARAGTEAAAAARTDLAAAQCQATRHYAGARLHARRLSVANNHHQRLGPQCGPNRSWKQLGYRCSSSGSQGG